MPSILPDPTDAQVQTRYFTCPNCGEDAKSTATHAATDTTLRSGCLCANGHIWTVHWMVS